MADQFNHQASALNTQKPTYQDLRDLVVRRDHDTVFSTTPQDLARQVPIGLRTLMLFDKDGSLDRFVADRNQAYVPDPTREYLEKLSEIPGVRLALASGRSVEELKILVGKIPVAYFGQHGNERCQGDSDQYDRRIQQGECQYRLAEMKERILEDFRRHGIPSQALEDKGGNAIAAHWRGREAQAEAIENIFREAVLASNLLAMGYKYQPGSMVLELAPAGRTKGDALKELLAESKFDYVLCVGDDTTDLSMMRARSESEMPGMDLIVSHRVELPGAYHVKSPVKLRVFLKELVNRLKPDAR